MTCTNRTALTLSFLCLLIPIFSQTARSQSPESAADSQKAFIIAGRVGVAGAAIRGLPGDPITDDNGVYAAKVPGGFTGIVAPTKEGYSFEPPSRTYARVTENLPNQDYMPKFLTFTISGKTGVSGVVMQGLPGEPTTVENGFYTATVPYGWTGRVTPEKEGHVFQPDRKDYAKVTADLRNEDYKARVRMLTISDTIKADNEPIADVKVTEEPGGTSVTTDSQGRYTILVPYGWTGRLIFSKEGLVFDPDNKPFTNVTRNIVSGQPQPSGKWPPDNRAPATPSRPPVALPTAAGNVFVIPTAQVVPEKVAETAEDLRIMLQILREKLSEPRMIQGAFVNFGDFFGDRDRALEAFYLQGCAAVFVLEMDSPFAFAPVPPGADAAGKEAVDPVWQRARERLSAPQNPALRDPRGLPGETEKMDFQQFKEDLLKTLRHAANLRNVQPDESILVTIIAHDESGWPAPASVGGAYGGGGLSFEGSSYSGAGSSFGPGGGSTYADSRTRSSGSTAGRGRPAAVPPGPAPAAPGTVLTIQAKKADINAFAQGGLSFEQFQQRVKTFTY
jgi:hypothetical protein